MEGDVEDERLNRPPRWAEPFEKDWDKPFEQYWNAPVGKDWEALFQKDWEAPFEQRSHETAEQRSRRRVERVDSLVSTAAVSAPHGSNAPDSARSWNKFLPASTVGAKLDQGLRSLVVGTKPHELPMFTIQDPSGFKCGEIYKIRWSTNSSCAVPEDGLDCFKREKGLIVAYAIAKVLRNRCIALPICSFFSMDPASFERDEAGCGAIYSSHVSDLHLARSPRSGIDPVVANMNLDQRMILGSASIILYNRPQVFRNRLIALAIGKVTEDHRERFENSYWKESQGIRDSSYSGAQFAKDMDLAHRLSGMDSSYSAAELPREFQGVGESTLESTVPDLGLADLDMQYYRGSVALPQEAETHTGGQKDEGDPRPLDAATKRPLTSLPYFGSTLNLQSSGGPRARRHIDADMSDTATTVSKVFSSARTVSTDMDMPSFMDEDEQALYKDRMERAEPEHGGTPWDPKADKQFRPTRSPENNRFFQKFVRYVVGMFMGDPELRELYKQATLQIDEATFKRNNERLLRRLYADLRPRARKSRRTRFLELLTHHDTRVEVSRKVYHATMKLHLKHGVKVAYLDLGTKMWEFSTEIPRDSPHSDIKSRPRRHFRLDRTSNTWSFWPPAQDGDAQIASTSLPEIQDDPGDIPGDPDNEKHFEHLLNGEYRFEAAARFITTGHPFQLYKDRFRDYLHPVSKPGYASDDTAATVPGTQSEGRGHRSEGTRPQGGTEASAQGPLMDPGYFSPLPELLGRLLGILLARREPPVPAGKTRIRWKCRCGEELFDDFVEYKPGSLDAMRRRLQERNRPEHGDTTEGSFVRRMMSRYLSPSAMYSWIRMFGSNRPRQGQGHNDAGGLPLHTAPAPAASQAPAPPQETAYLMLCIDKGETETTLYQERVDGIATDKELFLFLKAKYRKHRGFSWPTMRHIRNISVRRFHVTINNFAGINSGGRPCQPMCVCIPSKERVESHEYRCAPEPEAQQGYVCPLLSEKELLHYFHHPHYLGMDQYVYYDQIPKRTAGELKAPPSQRVQGWGLHFEEGWHWPSILYVFVLVDIIPALVFGIAWTIVKNDIQGGFSVAATWLAVGTVPIGLLGIRDMRE